MKKIIQHLIAYKNPEFCFAEGIGHTDLLALVFQKTGWLLRGMAKLSLKLRAPKLVFMGREVQLRYIRKLSLAPWVRLEEGVILSALGKGGLSIGKGTRIGAYSRVIVGTSFSQPGSHIHIGKNVGVGEFAYLGGGGGLEIGDDCIIGQYFSCHPENHNYENPDRLIRLQGVTRKGIKIGKNCWIGSKVTILDGVEVGEGSIIAAGAVVTHSMPAGAVVGGVPARIIKMIPNATTDLNPQPYQIDRADLQQAATLELSVNEIQL